jgi:hypothetical protein
MPVAVWLFLFASATMLASADLVALTWSDESSKRFCAGSPALALLRRRRGRPRNFAEPSRTVTLTLPESAIARLSAVHDDLSQAIVGLIDHQRERTRRKGADLLVFGRQAVITIRPTRSLEIRAGVQLVPLPDGRALIALDDPSSLSALQLTLADALDDPALPDDDRSVYENLTEILRAARTSADVSVAQRRIIVLESTRAVRLNGKAPAAASRRVRLA